MDGRVTTNLNSDFDTPTPAGVLGDVTFSPTPITSHSSNTTPADSRLLQIFLNCMLLGFLGRFLFLLPPSGVATVAI